MRRTRGAEGRGMQSATSRGTRQRRKKSLKGRITSGILVFAFHLDQSRFPDFPSFRRREPPLELDVHCTGETGLYTILPPTSWRRILSRVRPFNGVSEETPKDERLLLISSIISSTLTFWNSIKWQIIDWIFGRSENIAYMGGVQTGNYSIVCNWSYSICQILFVTSNNRWNKYKWNDNYFLNFAKTIIEKKWNSVQMEGALKTFFKQWHSWKILIFKCLITFDHHQFWLLSMIINTAANELHSENNANNNRNNNNVYVSSMNSTIKASQKTREPRNTVSASFDRSTRHSMKK